MRKTVGSLVGSKYLGLVKGIKPGVKPLRGSSLRLYVHLGSVLTLQNPGPYPKDSDTEGLGREPGTCLLSALQGDSAAGSPLTDLAVVGSLAPEA